MNILAALAAAIATAAGAPQHFVLTGKTVHGHGSPIHVTATGPISGTGLGAGVHLKNGSDRTTIRFAKGTIVISSHQTRFSAKRNRRTCTATVREHGLFHILRGTGAYKGAIGGGRYLRRSHLVGARSASGKCLGPKAPPAAVYDHVTMNGTIRLA
jgi:hypothetical protein